MNDSSALQLHQQIYKHLIALCVLLIIIGTSVFSAVYFPTLNSDKTTERQLITTTSQLQYLQNVATIRQQLEKLLGLENTKNYKNEHIILIEKLKTVDFKQNPSIKLSQWLVENNQNNEIVNRISTNSERNNQLKQQAVEQVTLLIAQIEKIMTNSSNHYYFVQLLKNKLLVMRTQLVELNIKSSSLSFELLAEQSKSFFTLVVKDNLIGAGNELSPELKAFYQQTKQLKTLLMTENRTLAKWRGHLRLVVTYRESLTKQLQQLPYQVPPNNNAKKRNNYAEESFLLTLERVLTLSKKQTLFVSLASLSTVVFLYLLFLLSQRLKRHGEVTIALVDGLLYDQGLEHIFADSLETLYLQQQLAKVTKPEFSDENYQNMVENYQNKLEVLADINGVAYWQLFAKNKLLGKNINRILLNENKTEVKRKASWRGYFSKSAVKTIIALAKKVRKEEKSQSIYVDTYANENVLLHLCYQHGKWFGTLADAKKNSKFQLKIAELEAEIIRQNKAFSIQDNQKKHRLNEMLVQAMLQSQSHSYRAQSSMQEYRQFAKILEWLRQQQIITRLENNGKAINLTEINIFDETYAAVINAMCEAGQHKNEISLSLDEKILPQIKQDARLFQRLIIVSLRLILNQQINVSSAISLTLLNRSSNQQTIKILVQLNYPTANKNVPAFIGYLLEHGKYRDDNTPDLIHYFQLLLSSLHGSSLSVITLPQGFELSFELTMETLNQQAIKLERSYLIQRDICNFDDKPTCRYDKTHVELLLAVSKPEKHLGLLSLLHWFGLQVRVVSSAQAMKKHWQTGRYLVLLNAFELSPFIELAVGSAISRGVFNFSGIENGILSESQQRLSKNWLLGNLPKKLDLTSLEQLLKPWLKEKKILVHKNTEVDVSQKSVVVLDGNNASAYEPQDSKPAPAFDMFQYTENQGGPESAVYMLDEYLESNQESLTKLRQAIASENDIFAQQALDQLVKNAQILAAQKTIMLCTLLNDALYKKDFALMLKLLDDFTEQLLLVDAYAKTI